MTPAGIHASSKSFHHAYELCYGNGLPANNGVPNAIVPGVVCLVFAIELGFKAILASDGISNKKIHPLVDLFERLSPDSKSEVIFESGVEGESFLENLKLVSSAFQEWRYIHEHRGIKSISMPFLEMLWTGVNIVASRRVERQRAELRANLAAEAPNQDATGS